MADRGDGYKAQAVAEGAFNYDQTVQVETSQKCGKDTWTVALGGVSNQAGPFTIPIEPQVDKYLMANTCTLETVVSVVREDGTECEILDDIVAPVDQLARAMWKTVTVTLNGHELDTAPSLHANYKAFIEDLFTNSQDTRLTHMVTQFHHPDTPGEFENMSVDEETMIKLMVQAIEQGRVVPQGFEYPVHMRLPGEPGYVAPVPAPATPLEVMSMRATRLRLRHDFLTDACRQEIRGDHAANTRTLHPHMRANHGFVSRYKLSGGSARMNLIAPIQHDFFQMDNHVGPGNRIEVKLHRAPDSFLLNTYLNERYRLKLHDIKLHMHTITRRESVPPPVVERYRLSETHLKTHGLPNGMTDYTYRVHYEGVMPKTLILGMVPTQAAEGAYNRNPFNFQHFGLSQVWLDLSGDEYPSGGGLKFDFSQHPTPHMARGYRWIFENSGALARGKGNLISYPGFETGQFLIPFDLNPDKCNGHHNHQPTTGHIDIRLKFAEPLVVPISLVTELVFNKVLVNDKGRGIVKTVDIQA